MLSPVRRLFFVCALQLQCKSRRSFALRGEVTTTLTYVIACPGTKQALLIDPVLGQVDRDLELLQSMGLWASFVSAGVGEAKKGVHFGDLGILGLLWMPCL